MLRIPAFVSAGEESVPVWAVTARRADWEAFLNAYIVYFLYKLVV